ncbi:MAG: acetyl-coenzyme A synthetase, partial [Candidatus Delongbacteria bacterium]|nr:acetyl-coenzyme A synthetase [Candidatus Delongbacteria bacterium]
MADKKAITSLAHEGRTFPPSAEMRKNAHISSDEQYKEMWEKSIKDPDGFWLEQAKTLHWFKEPTMGLKYNWDTKNRIIEHTWFEDGEMNVSYNCL